MLENEVKMSRKDFNVSSGKPSSVNMFDKRQRTELKNIEASRLIKAAKLLNEKFRASSNIAPEIIKARQELNSSQLIETKYSLEVINKQTKEMERRIKDIEKKQEDANGFIKDGDVKKLEMYKAKVDELLKLKKEINKADIKKE